MEAGVLDFVFLLVAFYHVELMALLLLTLTSYIKGHRWFKCGPTSQFSHCRWLCHPKLGKISSQKSLLERMPRLMSGTVTSPDGAVNWARLCRFHNGKDPPPALKALLGKSNIFLLKGENPNIYGQLN